MSFFGVRRGKEKGKENEKAEKYDIYNKRNNPHSLTHTHSHICAQRILSHTNTSSYTTIAKNGNNTIINKNNINNTYTHTPASEAKKARVTNFVVSRKKN